MTYIDIVSHIEKDNDECNNWKFKSNDGHEGPLSKEDHNCKGSRFFIYSLIGTQEKEYMNPLTSLLRMIHFHVQSMPKRMTY